MSDNKKEMEYNFLIEKVDSLDINNLNFNQIKILKVALRAAVEGLVYELNNEDFKKDGQEAKEALYTICQILDVW